MTFLENCDIKEGKLRRKSGSRARGAWIWIALMMVLVAFVVTDGWIRLKMDYIEDDDENCV